MARYPVFAPKDLDGFFGLFVDNLVQLLLIVALCGLCGMRPDSPLLLNSILPGAALSILVGNLFYAVQAHWLARKEGRSDVTALPYGINTPSLLVYIFLVMLPAYNQALADRVSPDDAARYA
jgi:AGZA family xanthine/uracil permease-like MFS transporter